MDAGGGIARYRVVPAATIGGALAHEWGQLNGGAEALRELGVAGGPCVGAGGEANGEACGGGGVGHLG